LVTPASASIEFGFFDGLFIPGLNKGVGLFHKIERATPSRYPQIQPGVFIEPRN